MQFTTPSIEKQRNCEYIYITKEADNYTTINSKISYPPLPVVSGQLETASVN